MEEKKQRNFNSNQISAKLESDAKKIQSFDYKSFVVASCLIDHNKLNGMELMIPSSSTIGNSALCLTLISILIFLFFLTTPTIPTFPDHHPHLRSLLDDSTTTNTSSIVDSSCFSSRSHDNGGGGVINYFSLHYCIFDQNLFFTIPILSLLILLHFYILIKTAQTHFSTVTTKLADRLNLSPSMAAVTLLALGNGAPDVFASVAALRGGQYRTGFGAILSAGTFVSAFVVGFVAIYAAPFPVDAASFVRDVLFYLIAASFLFYVYLSGEIYVWQAIGFVGFYVFFVGFVFWMDFGTNVDKGRSISEEEKDLLRVNDCEIASGPFESHKAEKEHLFSGIFRLYGTISRMWETPVSVLLSLTIPKPSPSDWSRFYRSANIVFCPLALLYSCNSFVPLNHPISFLFPNTHLPLWLVVLLMTSSLAFLHFTVEKQPPKTEQLPVIVVAFIMSVFWISTIAGELLNCLAALGTLLKLPPALLGLTVLAWGNSVGDLVADVAVAKAGRPAMAMAGCFAGPMFNMLVGLGSALVMQTGNVYPNAYELGFHVGIVIAFVFLLLSLMGSLLVITWSRFRVPRFWGICLVGLYVVFTFVSLIIASLST
ncbi:PREDICTED: cation/calcium exchanger 5-like isoform X1 [Camelina sativa]|uniref:Cation/calcium exchanger 5-like isoform X1 n=1 Tax=Camelina sativa TaxID=90675 RepID=A0ABM0VLU4_CAMSA|nr:PREDICTED: cation/calcium exchanger 5-like isoform X1 [Camelina sativa]